MNNFLNGSRIMIVAAHPDDELLGLGATMHKLIKKHNVTTHVVILGEGIAARYTGKKSEKQKKEIRLHKQNIKKAQKAIGYHTLRLYNFPDNRFDTVALLDIIKTIEKEKNKFKPEMIFTHYGGDLNIDHQLTFEAVITACRPLANETVKKIITFETPSGTEWRASTDPKHFIPNLFFEVSEKDLAAKIKGMDFYEFEKRSYPHPRSPEALEIQAKRWGVIIGCEYAEAFNIIRAIY